jgi:ATP-dependent exoDNAse (exonuclease V) alpha subunit
MHMEINYSPSQLEAVKAQEPWVNDDEPFFRLSGSAGTGKSLITKKFLETLPSKRVIGLCSTHKACQQLQHYLGASVTVKTIDSFLGLQPKRNGKITSMVRSRKYDPSAYYDYDFAILDERCMVASDRESFLLEDVRTQDRRYIMVGDPCQLSPVNEDSSFTDRLEIPERYDKTLTEVHRFGGGILKVATDIRNAILAKDYGSYPLETSEEDGKGVYVLTEGEWNVEIKKAIKESTLQSNPDYLKILAYTNDAVIDYENRVARQLGRTPDEPFRVGDMVVVNEALTQNDELLLRTGEDIEILQLSKEEHEVYPGLWGWKMMVRRESGDVLTIVALDQTESRDAWKWTLDNLSRQAETGAKGWYQFYALRDYYADIRKGTASTVHKMQGSEAKIIGIDYGDLFKGCNRKDFNWAQADRLLYTAITRGREKVFIKI